VTTSVTITGSGTPIMRPGQAGPGVVVVSDGVVIQIDAGRGTSMRLTDLGIALCDLTAVCVTHHHSDHLLGLADLLMCRWLEDGRGQLPVVAPDGEATRIARGVLDVWANEIEMRSAHTGRGGTPLADVQGFAAQPAPTEVFRSGPVLVLAAAVEHSPVVPAVGYRIETPDGVVAVSGDTAVCPSLALLAADADVFVCEAFQRTGTVGLLSDPDAIAAYHADSVQVGQLAAQARVKTLMLTHLIPPVTRTADKYLFERDVREGGFTGTVIVADDLDQQTLSSLLRFSD
jgi:ribonuclease Z